MFLEIRDKNPIRHLEEKLNILFGLSKFILTHSFGHGYFDTSRYFSFNKILFSRFTDQEKMKFKKIILSLHKFSYFVTISSGQLIKEPF